jgi:hypothetical protein
LQVYEPLVGDVIHSSADTIVVLAQEHGVPAKMVFNNIELVAQPDSHPADIVLDYYRQLSERDSAYRASPEYKRAQRQRRRQQRKLNRQVRRLIDLLDDLDFTNIDMVMGWLLALAELDTEGADFNRLKLVNRFAQHGYEPGVYTGDQFDENDREVFARYCIGQFMAVYFDRPHLFRKFAERWRDKFVLQLET